MELERCYCAIVNGNLIQMLTKNDVIQLDKEMVTLVCKDYYPIIGNTLSDDKVSITLYNAGFSKSYNEFINDYNNLPPMYGTNAINEDDIEICKHYNSENNSENKNRNKRNRTESCIDEYEEYEE